MRRLVLLLMVPLTGWGADAWPGVAYAEVRAFAWRPYQPSPERPERRTLRAADGSPVDGAVKPEGAVLNGSQVQRLLKARRRPWGGMEAHIYCYVPHHLFVFYDRTKKPVASIEVCLSCLNTKMLPEDNEANTDFRSLARILNELKLPLGDYKSLKDFEKRMAKSLNARAEAAAWAEKDSRK